MKEYENWLKIVLSYFVKEIYEYSGDYFESTFCDFLFEKYIKLSFDGVLE